MLYHRGACLHASSRVAIIITTRLCWRQLLPPPSDLDASIFNRADLKVLGSFERSNVLEPIAVSVRETALTNHVGLPTLQVFDAEVCVWWCFRPPRMCNRKPEHQLWVIIPLPAVASGIQHLALRSAELLQPVVLSPPPAVYDVFSNACDHNLRCWCNLLCIGSGMSR